MAVKKQIREIKEKIKNEDLFLLDEIKTMFLKFNINLHFLESLYFFDYDIMNYVVRGSCVKVLLEEKEFEADK